MSLKLKQWLAKDNLRRIAGLLWFDLVWFSTVAGREPWLPIALPIVAVQIYLSSTREGFSWVLFLQLLVLGLALESTVVALGILDFTGGWLPLWLIALWFGFAAMVTTSLDWLSGRYVLAALLGLASGPLTYAIGSRLGAAELLVDEYLMWIAYGILWALYMVIFAYLMKRNAATYATTRETVHG
ncbi:DUF2878 domain-containing protein [Pseudidiomarina sp. 1APP75-32.1]|uniref:DUF2878 domain-containing protein n=1 Tax=Pseudidiomarina terrestris TaxID=2820060 RepID=A0AAW7QZ95_9GAMM|nr:DUF2878 domain-containing protein [Pseudidiomarina sp. 1APP75-32.1]MDN7124200.1 DUF2878 domain-containing protein [Pseudidiomarina sp. 1APP75-32.1]